MRPGWNLVHVEKPGRPGGGRVPSSIYLASGVRWTQRAEGSGPKARGIDFTDVRSDGPVGSKNRTRTRIGANDA